MESSPPESSTTAALLGSVDEIWSFRVGISNGRSLNLKIECHRSAGFWYIGVCPSRSSVRRCCVSAQSGSLPTIARSAGRSAVSSSPKPSIDAISSAWIVVGTGIPTTSSPALPAAVASNDPLKSDRSTSSLIPRVPRRTNLRCSRSSPSGSRTARRWKPLAETTSSNLDNARR